MAAQRNDLTISSPLIFSTGAAALIRGHLPVSMRHPTTASGTPPMPRSNLRSRALYCAIGLLALTRDVDTAAN